MLDGVVVVDKPRGPTSHDVVARARRALATPAVGHAGTLDPMATGVLVLAIGEATKLVAYLTDQRKAYRATVRLGLATRSLDADGEVQERRELPPELISALADAEAGRPSPPLRDALEVERARKQQIPPAVSAIKMGGLAAHRRARRGESLEMPPRSIEIARLDLLAARVDPAEIDLEIECAKGFYVRALARDLAATLGTVGHLVALRRTQSGRFTLADAVPGDALDGDRLRAALIPLRVAAEHALGLVELTEEGVVRARHGKVLDADAFAGGLVEGARAWVDARGELVALGEVKDGVGRVLRGFRAR